MVEFEDSLKQNLEVVINTLYEVLKNDYIKEFEKRRIRECIDLLKKW
jgi:hypothetical protein